MFTLFLLITGHLKIITLSSALLMQPIIFSAISRESQFLKSSFR